MSRFAAHSNAVSDFELDSARRGNFTAGGARL
jgi:hypothetical protein